MDKNTLIGFLLIGVVLFAFSWFNRPTPEQLEAQRRYQDSIAKIEYAQQLESYEKENPYRYGMKKAEVQMTHFKGMKPNVFDKVIELLETEGYVKRVGEFLCTPQFEIKKDETYNKIAKTVLGTFESAKYDFAKYSEIDFGKTPRAMADDILNVLLVEGKVVKIAEDMYTLTEYMEEAKNIIREKLAEDPVITIAQVRDIFATSRKSAKPYAKPVIQVDASTVPHTVVKQWEYDSDKVAVDVELKAYVTEAADSNINAGNPKYLTSADVKNLPTSMQFNLSETNNWTHTWENLPTKYFYKAADGSIKETDIHYTVEEVQTDATKAFYGQVTESSDGKTTTILNKKKDQEDKPFIEVTKTFKGLTKDQIRELAKASSPYTITLTHIETRNNK